MRGWVLGGACVAGAAAAACGRLGFDASDQRDAVTPMPDAAPLPALVCNRVFIPLDGVPDSADLAMAGMGTAGLAMIWTPTAGGRAVGLRVDATGVPTGPVVALQDNTTAIGGLVDTGAYLLASIEAPPLQTVVRYGRDFSAPLVTSSEASLLGREAFAAEQTGVTRAWLRGTGSGATGALLMSYARPDGNIIATGQPYPVGSPVSAVAGDDGPDHAHAVWREDVSQVIHRCTASDIDFIQPDTPVMGSMQVITDDCMEVRNASGPPPADSMIIVWRTSAGAVLAKYIASTGDVDTPLSMTGRAPKVRFDGVDYWVAWIDAPTGFVVLARLALDGTLTAAPLVGRVPAGDEAFELVRNAGVVQLGILEAGGLEILTPCQGGA